MGRLCIHSPLSPFPPISPSPHLPIPYHFCVIGLMVISPMWTLAGWVAMKSAAAAMSPGCRMRALCSSVVEKWRVDFAGVDDRRADAVVTLFVCEHLHQRIDAMFRGTVDAATQCAGTQCRHRRDGDDQPFLALAHLWQH